MKKLIALLLGGTSVVVCGAAMTAPVAFAATPSAGTPGTGQALEIAPPLITLRANPGQTVQAKIQLRDVSSVSLAVTNQINDFVAAGEDGTPKILTDNDNSPFSIRDWITPLPAFTVLPQKIQTLSVTIKVPTNASPGGHYGIIRFTGTPPHLNGTGVSLSASLGALVLLTVNGKITDSLSITQFATTQVPPAPNPNNPKPVNPTMKPVSLFESTPLDFTLMVKNTGNIQEAPVGHILITDMFGKAVAGVNVNLDQRNVLPDSTRKFDALLNHDSLGGKRLFGRYQAVITVKYGVSSHLTTTASLYFWVIPYKLIGTVVVLLIGGFFILRILIRRYNQHIIGKAQNSRHKPARKR